MFIFLLFLFLISIISSVGSVNPTEFAEDTLSFSHGDIIFSSVFFRHGERAPLCQYPSDPYEKESFWKEYWPQGKTNLSEVGKLELYNLGKWFRKRYDSFVTVQDLDQLLIMDASEANRAILSATCFLNGFADQELASPSPVEIHYYNMISFVKMGCARYDSEKKNVNLCPQLRQFYSNYHDTINYVAGETQLEFSATDIRENIKIIYLLNDTLYIEQSCGLPLPKWANGVYPQPLKTIGDRHLLLQQYTHEMRKLRAGPLIGKMIREMELKIQNKFSQTFHFYSGHETTVSGLLVSLGLFDGNPPPYAASLLFELRKKSDKYIVTISYRNTITSAPNFLQLRGCDSLCTFEKFKELTENLIPENWENECKEAMPVVSEENNDNPESSVSN